MASSNLKSIVIKQNTSYIETMTDVNFRLLYNAIKEVVDYWAQLSISQEDKITPKIFGKARQKSLIKIA